MRIESEGVHESEAALDELVKAIRDATPVGVDKVMDKLVRQTKVQLSQGQHAPGTPTGSIPPAPPWRISNKLRDSPKKTRARRIGTDRWRGEAGPSGVIYARIHELGGTIQNGFGRGVRIDMPKRPYLKPAWRIVKPTAGRVMAKVWRDAIRSVLR